MANYTRCTLCEAGGTSEKSTDIERIPSNVRRFCKEEFTLWRCGNCKSIHCLEEVDLQHYYEGYPLNSLQLNPPIQMAYRNRLTRLERLGLKRTHRVLDFGCGGGLFVDFLRSRGFQHVSGYDNFVPRYASEETLRTSHYDFIVSYDVIEHVEDPAAYMNTVRALLRPGGRLAVGTPRAEAVDLERKHDMVLHPPYHRHILSEKVLIRLGKETGLTAVDVCRRSMVDSLIPTLNGRFITSYVEATGGVFDAVMEGSQTLKVVTSPKLMLLAIFGYFLPRGEHMVVTFGDGARPA